MNPSLNNMLMIDRDSKRPLYIQIQDYVVDLIRSGALKPGQTVQSEYELAEQTGVSRLTVRKAYTELAKKGMLQTVQGKGTFVAETLDRRLISDDNGTPAPTKRVIGILFPEVTEYFGRILREIEMRASHDGYAINVMFNDSIERERHAIDQMLAQNLAGVILTPYRLKRSGVIIKNYEELSLSGLPFVMIGRPTFHITCDATYVDDTIGTYDAVQLLISKGHREFVFIYNGIINDPQAISERSEGFRLALRTLSTPVEARLLDIGEDGWQAKLRRLLTADIPVTAVVADGDGTAAAGYNVIFESGKRIPDDVSVVGYDNSYLCENLQVKLTSVAPNRILLGYHAYELLKARINRTPDYLEEAVTHNIVIKPRLVLRNSIGPLPKQ